MFYKGNEISVLILFLSLCSAKRKYLIVVIIFGLKKKKHVYFYFIEREINSVHYKVKFGHFVISL